MTFKNDPARRQPVRQYLSTRLTRQSVWLRLIPLILILGIGGTASSKMYHRTCARKERAMREKLSKIREALGEFQKSCGRYPLTEEGLMALSKKPSGLTCSGFPENGFVTQLDVLADPWGSRYIYISQGQSYVVRSLGADGRPGGVGSERDVEIQSASSRNP